MGALPVMSNLGPPLAAFALLGASVSAGLSVVDDDGGAGVDFIDIQAAVDAALEGDALLVRSGSYGPFTVDGKTLSIVFEPGAVVAGIPDFFNMQPIVRVRNLTASQNVLLLGLDVVPASPLTLGLTGPAIDVAACQGTVWIEDAHITEGSDPGAVSIVDSTSVVLTRSTVVAAWGFGFFAASVSVGVAVDSSTLHLYDSAITGGPGLGSGNSISCSEPLSDGGAALRVANGSVFASGCRLLGGVGGDGGDALVQGGHGSDGGAGLEFVDASSTVETLECTLLGGAGGSAYSSSCNDGQDGVPVTGPGTLVALPGEARSFASTTPVREGQPWFLVVGGEPGEYLIGVASLGTSGVAVPGVVGSLLLGFPFTLVPVGPIPATGEATFPLTAAPLAPGLLFHRRFLQPLTIAAGGALHLGAPTALVVLDGTL